jgi:hypothetical protein
MPTVNCKSTITREAVLAELALMAEGRHPDCNTITGRFIRDPELQHASKILSDAIQAEYHHQPTSDMTPPPPAWLLPA